MISQFIDFFSLIYDGILKFGPSVRRAARRRNSLLVGPWKIYQLQVKLVLVGTYYNDLVCQ